MQYVVLRQMFFCRPFINVHCTRPVSFWSVTYTNLMIVASAAISTNGRACQYFQWDTVADITYMVIHLLCVVQI